MRLHTPSKADLVLTGGNNRKEQWGPSHTWTMKCTADTFPTGVTQLSGNRPAILCNDAAGTLSTVAAVTENAPGEGSWAGGWSSDSGQCPKNTLFSGLAYKGRCGTTAYLICRGPSSIETTNSGVQGTP